ncbi:pantoate--beta-alanine ligase [Sphingomicrobium sp. XHP0239]|uniref:pantoate--beta-alanine ligase n=1 Tax=Sphingomicrobium maritimum TaxID=3133972 RepID=UPI0031CC9E11
MQIIRDKRELNAALAPARDRGRVALVPTMGALHDGHLALVRAAAEQAETVIASIFVNPLQFNDKGDLDRYPRDEEADAEKLDRAGCDLVWLPTPDALYPPGFATSVHVAGLTDRWEGDHRPGHFDGVATVVTKLFTNVRPDVAIFGEKDFQQLAIIRRLNADLDLGVEIVGLPTVRAEDGMALSSRNALLSQDARRKAASLNAALRDAAAGIASGRAVDAALADARARLEAAGFGTVDYVAYVDAATLEPLDGFRSPGRLLAAATIDGVRLIDNIAVGIDDHA